jgi:hypothetical protein
MGSLMKLLKCVTSILLALMFSIRLVKQSQSFDENFLAFCKDRLLQSRVEEEFL